MSTATERRIRHYWNPAATLFTLALIAGFICVIVAIRQAKHAAVFSYLCAVCAAIQRYEANHGVYPKDLREIDTSQVDNSEEISVDSLSFTVVNGSVTVSYDTNGRSACSCTLPGQ